MEEIVYTILYKKELLSEEQNSYHFTPCYIVKGLYDEEDNVFLDEINKSRYSMKDSRVILEDCDYCIGDIYTEKQLKKKYPNAVSFEQIEINLFKEAESFMTIGVYDKNSNKINVNKYSYDGLIPQEEIIESNVDIVENVNLNNNNDDQQMFKYENVKEQLGIDFSLFTPQQVTDILNIDDIKEVQKYIIRIKENKTKYESIVNSMPLSTKHILLADNIVDYIIESKELEEIKNIFAYYSSLDPTELEPTVEDYDTVNVEEYKEEEVANIFNSEDFVRVTEETINNLTEANDIVEVKNILNNILDFYITNMSIIEMLREYGYNFFKTYHYFYSQSNYINELLKFDDMNKIKREYKLLFMKSKNTIKSVINELEYDVDKTEIKKAYKETLEKLNNLVGLKKVKTAFDGIFSSIMFKSKTNQNLEFEESNKHMVFTGNPGTGKTTVTEIIAPAFYKLGYLTSDRVAFVAAQDLVAGYVGQTAIKTEKLIKQNQGGVIVIDEAYILAGKAQQFGNEAITVILKEMEKNRTMFIFAGYKKEMEDFIKMNSGLKSRINTYIQFDDYNEKELTNMFIKRVNDANKEKLSQDRLTLSIKARMQVQDVIKKAMMQRDFGNGRFVKNIFDIIITNHAKNTNNIDNDKRLYKITEEDIPDDILEQVLFSERHNSNYSETTMGFGAKIKK